MMNCPICDRKIKNYIYDHINHTMCEEHAECSDEHHYYGYTYAFGNSVETLGNIAFHEYWNTDHKIIDKEIHNDIYKLTLELMRNDYRKKAGIWNEYD